MTSHDTIFDRFAAWPRAMRWMTIAVVLVLAFLAWDGTVGKKVDEWNEAADSIEQEVQHVIEAEAMRARLLRMNDTIVGLGPVDLPGEESAERSALTNTVVEVFKDRSLDREVSYSFDQSGGGDKLREDLTRNIVRPGGRVMRLAVSLKFEASPDDAIKIISLLESREEVDAIRKVTMTKGDGRSGPRVKVALTIETWVEASSSQRRRHA